MNRQTILASIYHHLRENLADTGEVRPLGEIVPLVANEIRAGELDIVSGSHVIPIEQVAAFVDGDLSADETEQVCQSVLVDNSVLAELIAAARAKSESHEPLPELSEALMGQLNAMRFELPGSLRVAPVDQADASDASRARFGRAPTNAGTVSEQTVSEQAVSEQAVSEQAVSDEPKSRQADTEATESADIGDNVVPAPPAGSIQVMTADSHQVTASKSRRPVGWIAGLVAVAAAIIVIITLATRPGSNESPDPHELAVSRPDPDHRPENSEEVVERPGVPDPSDRRPIMDVAVEDNRPHSEPVPDRPSPPPGGDAVVAVPPNDVPDSRQGPPDLPDPMPDSVGPDPGPALASVPKLSSLRWKSISGVLAREEAGVGSAASVRRWASVKNESYLSARAADVFLRTLPKSRAEAQLEDGGKIVLAGDSGVDIRRSEETASASIDLKHGAIAMIDLPEGTVIEVRQGDRLIVSLRWIENASAVLQRVASGLEIHVDKGTLEVNDRPLRDESVSVAANQSVRTIDRPKRLPTWVDRPTDSIGIPRNILAQIAETDNVMRTLNQRVVALASQQRLSANDKRELLMLTTWQAAMADSNLFRMAGSKIPAMRLAALTRLANMPRTDPRFVRTWLAIDRVAGNKQRAGNLRRWCEMARQGVRPNNAQVTQMIAGLSSQEVGVRAMSDFVLRQYYGNGPMFDPTWTGQQQQRAIAAWRTRVGLPANRVTPSAAARVPNDAAN